MLTTEHFFVLDYPKINSLDELENFSLDTLSLERLMQDHNGGIDLANLERGSGPESDDLARRYVPFFEGENYNYDAKEVEAIIQPFNEIKRSSSMSVKSEDELLQHMLIAYQVSHFHYLLGKKHDLNDSFPNYCCIGSANSVALSLMQFGYANAVVGSHFNNHSYVLLPFVLKDKNINGSILIDPTYDQLWNEEKNVRNAVMIKLGTKWEYKTDWKDGADLYPNGIMNHHIIQFDLTERLSQRKRLPQRKGYPDCEMYLQEAFSNPLNIHSDYSFAGPEFKGIYKFTNTLKNILRIN